jgi:hypothetical protein
VVGLLLLLLLLLLLSLLAPHLGAVCCLQQPDGFLLCRHLDRLTG